MNINKKDRLLGLDLMRGIAAFAVIFLHSPFVDVPYAPGSIALRNIFSFAVPFFLATSFYFYALKLNSVVTWEFWRLRFQRIVIPYFLWSLIYFCIQFMTFWRSHKTEKLTALLADPVGIIFCGGAAAQLYFLPLLMSGTALMIFGLYLQKCRVNISVLAGLTVLSLFFYSVSLDLNLLFRWDQPFAFKVLLDSWQLIDPLYTFCRLILILFSWWILCLPHLLGSMMLVKIVSKFDEIGNAQRSKIRWWATSVSTFYLLMYIAFSFYRKPDLDQHLDLWVIFAAYSLLALGIFNSPHLKFSKPIESVSLCSFGIYLVHQPVLYYIVRQLIIMNLPELSLQVSILSMLIASLLCFFLSWFSMIIVIQNKTISRYLFGLF